MRKSVSLTLSLSLFLIHTFMRINTSWAHPAPHCVDYLNKIEESTVDSQVTNSQKTLEGVKDLLLKAKKNGFVTKSKYDHLLDDLNELENVLQKKTKHNSFNLMMDQWSIFLNQLNLSFESYLNLKPEEQKKYFSKMQLPLTFMTSHFVTFLETSNLKFKYQRMHQILKASNAQVQNADLMLYLYQFEKQILKYFSIKEFLSCKA